MQAFLVVISIHLTLPHNNRQRGPCTSYYPGRHSFSSIQHNAKMKWIFLSRVHLSPTCVTWKTQIEVPSDRESAFRNTAWNREVDAFSHESYRYLCLSKCLFDYLSCWPIRKVQLRSLEKLEIKTIACHLSLHRIRKRKANSSEAS